MSKLRPFLGRVPTPRALQHIVGDSKRAGLHLRIGSHILTTRKNGNHLPDFEKVKSAWEKIALGGQTGPAPSLSVLRTAELSHDIINWMQREKKPISAVQLASALIYRENLSSSLTDVLRNLSNVEKNTRHREAKFWHDSIGVYYDAVKSGLPENVLNLLSSSRRDSLELYSLLLVKTKREQKNLIFALNLLDQAGLITKDIPKRVDGKTVNVWRLRGKPQPIHYEPITTLRVLNDVFAAHQNGKPFETSTEYYHTHGINLGSKNPILKLQHAGLVHYVKGQKKRFTVVPGNVTLTEKGIKLMKQYSKSGIVPSELRAILLQINGVD